MAVQRWVKDLTEDVFGGAPVRIGYYYQHPVDGAIKITSGQYWGEHGISNFWYWEIVSTGQTGHGYANQDWPRINVPEEHALSYLLGALVHALKNGDIAEDVPVEWFTELLHECAIGRFEHGYITNDPRT